MIKNCKEIENEDITQRTVGARFENDNVRMSKEDFSVKAMFSKNVFPNISKKCKIKARENEPGVTG